MQPLAYPSITFQNPGDIRRVINQDPNIKAFVEGFTCNFSAIDAEYLTRKLTQVGTLLQLAYCGSKGQACQAQNLKLLIDSQSLINASVNTTDFCMSTTIRVLNIFRKALYIVEDDCEDSMPEALKIIEYSIKCAENMEKCLEKMANQAKNLCGEAGNALLAAAQEESNITIKKEAAQAKLTQLIEEQHTLIGKIRNLEEAEEGNLEERLALQSELRETKADLAGTREKIKGSVDNIDSLKESIESLEITISALGKIQTIFANNSLFWIRTKNQYASIANMDHLKDSLELVQFNDRYKIKLINAIKFTGLSCLAFADMNYQIAFSLPKAKKHADEILSNLPTKKAASRLVKERADELFMQIAEENNIFMEM